MSQAITRSSLDDLRSFDLTDLAAGAGALQLLPENADRLVRLEMLADWVVSLATTNESRSKVSYESWYPLVNDPPVADASTLEDPFNCLFTEVLTFHGGCNVVFPGLAEDATFILRQLFVALFHGEPQIGDDSFRGSAIRIIQSVLVLSNEIARRASLPRGLPPASGAREECVVPDLDRF